METALGKQPHVQQVNLPDQRQLLLRYYTGHGRALVLLHGLLDSSEGWAGLVEATHRPVYAFDLPGFGDSSLPAAPRISAYADDVIAALRKIGLCTPQSHFTLIGHSLGGAVATAVAEMIPECVDALVLLAPAGFGRIHLAEVISVPVIRDIAAQALPHALTNRWLLTRAYRTMVTNGHDPSPEVLERVGLRARKALPGAREATRAVVTAGTAKDAFYRRQVAYNGPVLVLWGIHDRIVPKEHSNGVLAAFPQAKLVFWDQVGHHPQYERPQELEKLIEYATTRGRKRGRSYAQNKEVYTL